MPWPVKGDKLFLKGGDWQHSACLGWAPNKWDAYAVGYKDAADIVVEKATTTGRGLDTLVYPIAFLYRHYLELRLKELTTQCQQLLDLPVELKHRMLRVRSRFATPGFYLAHGDQQDGAIERLHLSA